MTKKKLCFQEMILRLHAYWSKQGCAILQPYDLEMGAGTFHPATTLKSLGPHPWRTAYVQPCRRPTDGRYGQNPNRVQHFYQYQVLIKPSPKKAQDLYLQSLREIGIDPLLHDIRFVEDNWESPTLGASGLGWEVWCDGQEITQFTYFQQMGGLECQPVSVELTYGLERVACVVQDVPDFFQLDWNGAEGEDKITYADIYQQNEREFSAYNFDEANTDHLFESFKTHEADCMALLNQKLPLPAYDLCVKASHVFNLLDARGVISVLERANYIARVRTLAKGCCEEYLAKEIAS